MTGFPDAVPSGAVRPFVAVAQLSNTQADALLDALEVSGALATPPELAQRVRERVPVLKPMITTLVFSILTMIGSLAQDLNEAAPLAKAISEGGQFDELTDEERQALAERVERLIRSPCLRLAAKAADIRTAYDHVFAEARVLTDVRPVFPDGQTAVPAAGVVVDTLRLDYYSADGVRKSFYVALDEEDLEALKEQATRGLEKSRGMRRFLEQANLVTWKDEWDATATD